MAGRSPVGDTPRFLLVHLLFVHLLFVHLLFCRYKHHPSEPRDVVFSGTAPMSACSTIPSGSLFTDLQRLTFWACIRKSVQSLSAKPQTTSAKNPWTWVTEFNVLLASNPLPIISSCKSDPPSSVELSPPSASFCDSFLQRWELWQQAASNKLESSSARNLGDLSLVQSVIESSYLDIVPEALVLPFEIQSSRIDGISFPLERLKRSRESNLFREDAKRLKLDPSLGVESIKTDSDSNIIEQQSKDEAVLYQPPNVLPKLFDISEWEPPLKPHSVMRADRRPLELRFCCGIELVTLPTLTEWMTFSRYFR